MAPGRAPPALLAGLAGPLIALVIAPFIALPAAADGPGPCRGSPALAGACFAVHGRLAVHNGSPAFRLHPAGSKRILGIVTPAGAPLEEPQDVPPEIRALFWRDADPAPVEGDFEVCPLTPERPGRMRMVCIVAGRNLVPRPGR
ncbi:MAG: hypothetical protein U1E53_30765 [Dongiaceae bacterium]